MTDYSLDDWQRLGRAVKRDRTQRAEYRDVKKWAAAIGRSTRIALGLERGEKVGDETLLRVEKLLGWPTDHAWRILEGSDVGPRRDDVLLGGPDNEVGADVVALFEEDPPLRIRMRRYEDLRRLGTAVRTSGAAIMDTTDVDDPEAIRMVDFAAGVVFGLGGRLDRLTARTFLLRAPEVPADSAPAQPARRRAGMAAVPEHPEDVVEEAAYHSPEPAGLPEPESP